MKKSILSLAVAFLTLASVSPAISAEGFKARVDGPRISIRPGGDSRLAYEIDRLNRQLRIVRGDLRIYGAGKRLRAEYYQLERATERVNAQYRQGIFRSWELRRRVERLRADVARLQREVRIRRSGPPILR